MHQQFVTAVNFLGVDSEPFTRPCRPLNPAARLSAAGHCPAQHAYFGGWWCWCVPSSSAVSWMSARLASAVSISLHVNIINQLDELDSLTARKPLDTRSSNSRSRDRAPDAATAIALPPVPVRPGRGVDMLKKRGPLVLIAEAVPKRILDVMNVAGLTRENVASHLQVAPGVPRGPARRLQCRRPGAGQSCGPGRTGFRTAACAVPVDHVTSAAVPRALGFFHQALVQIVRMSGPQEPCGSESSLGPHPHCHMGWG